MRRPTLASRMKGAYGAHYLADSAEYAGVRCTYNNSNVISSIRVRDPLAFAKNTTTRVDTQWVSWNFRVQKQTPASTAGRMSSRARSQKRTATDGQIANFSPITRAFAGSAAYQYRVVVVIRWYGAGGAPVVGSTTHRADWYSWVGVPSFKGLCPGGIF